MKACERLTKFLEENSEEFLQNWRSKVVLDENDLYKNEVIQNGVQMFELIKKSLRFPLNERGVKLLADKTAQERVNANVNISEFVYNMGIGKSEVVKWAGRSGIELHELQPLLDNINSLFDRFSYFAVRRYTEIKDKQLQDKDLFINQTHKERLTILGQMSSSFVHEFRNPLTSIIGFTSLLQKEYPDLPYLDIMKHELDQLNYRISQFLHVSRKEIIESKQEKVNLGSLLSELEHFLFPSLLAGDVQLNLYVESEIDVISNKGELRQVLLNLIVNSIDALQENETNRNIDVESEVSGDQIMLTVSNNGPKIKEEEIKAIFEPFFTTKDLGTGIGLYICNKLIEKHGGKLTCRSTDEKTDFIISFLPES
ncbi:histidine kinase N-terminal domain-containing protein [Bacillus sp. 2205SS5-2]|uniref:histidine kinase N-terminal domain-containing protein n=1 Tax=Bacillus sp. 2205SS5-2 TaxID=3109031 RepID=UPI003006F514